MNDSYSTEDHTISWEITTSDNTAVYPNNNVWTSTGAWVSTKITPTFTSKNYKKFKEKLS